MRHRAPGFGYGFDNALALTPIRPFKTEDVRRRSPWRRLDADGIATPEAVDRSDHRRFPAPIARVPSAEAWRCACAGPETRAAVAVDPNRYV